MVDIPTERAIQRNTPLLDRPSSPGPAPFVARSSAGAGLSSFGQGLTSAASNLDRIVDRQNQEAAQADAFETQRRFLVFASGQDDALKNSQESVQPGAFGYSEQARKGYMESAKGFLETVPDAFKDEYDLKLFGVEDKIVSRAATFERAARRSHYGASVDDGLAGIEGRLFSSPDEYDDILAEGNSLIDAIPDDGFSQIEKAELKRGWEEKAKLAVLNGVAPEERIRLLGGISEVEPAGVPQNVSKGIAGYSPDVKKAIGTAARRHGVSEKALAVIAWLESRGKPNAKNPNSSAGGLFQQIDSNARQYGVSNRMDANQSAEGAARFMADNTRHLRSVLGREPTVGELYLAHQQGPGGAAKLLSNPGARAADLVGSDAVRLNGGNADMTAGEFAQIWLKKAGDVHVPDGGLAGASFNPDSADPRFQNFDYLDAERAIQGARRELGAAISERDAAQKTARELASAQIGVSVTSGEATQADLDIALEDGQIAPQRWEALTEQIISRDNAEVKRNEDFNAVVEKLESGEAVNGLSSDERAGVNALDERLQESTQDNSEQLAATRQALIAQGSIAPQAMVDEILQGMNRQDPAAFAQAQAAYAANPQAFTGVPRGQQVVDGLNRFETYAGAGLDAETSAQSAMPTQEQRQQLDFVKADVKKELKEIETSDIISRFDTWMPGDAPDITPRAANDMMSDFGVIYEQARAEGMAPDAAREYSEKMLFNPTNGLYGVSELGGGKFKDGRWGDDLKTQRFVMRFPPENFYPAIDGSHDYIKRDIEESLRGLDDFGGKDWFLVADTSQTDNAVKAMRAGQSMLPGYRLYYTDENGAMQDAYWRIEPDQIEASKADTTAKRRSEFSESRKVEILQQFRAEIKGSGLMPGSPEYLDRWMDFKESADANL